MAGVSWPGRTRLSGSGGHFAGFGIGRRGGLVGGPRVTPLPCLRLLEPVALAVQLQNMDMMREAIEKRASETLATEDGGPFLEWKIRRDDGRATFVTPAEYFIGSVFARLPSAWAKARTCAGLTTTLGRPAPGQARRNHRLSIRWTPGRDHAR